MTNKLDNFYFSFSSVTTFETCKYAFKLSYLNKEEREGNFFSDYGSLMHDIIEKYLSEELDIWELLDFYEKEYYNRVTNPLPGFMAHMWDAYYDAGYKFFEEFDFDKDEIELINIEDFVRGKWQGINVVIKPDLIFKDKSGQIIIMDFKTSEIEKRGKIDKNKLAGYKKQIGLYIYYINVLKKLSIQKAKIWFLRSNTFYEWDYNLGEIIDDISWFTRTAREIRKEKTWEPNSSNKFFCNVLCGVRNSCEYKEKM